MVQLNGLARVSPGDTKTLELHNPDESRKESNARIAVDSWEIPSATSILLLSGGEMRPIGAQVVWIMH